MRLNGEWLHHPGTQAVFAALQSGGARVYFVGGCVRNALLGLPVEDIDLATTATPDRVTTLCTEAGLRVIPTGFDHGTVTVVSQGLSHEVTTFRQDMATDGRHAIVAFSDDIAKDAARRDFTMNALYATGEGTVIDPMHGLFDLQARRVRFVGDPAARIAEDYLRILRFFRFHAVYGDPAEGIDSEGLAACAANLAGLETLARERVGQEMRKLLSAADPAPAMASMAQAGVLLQILPGSDPRYLAPLVHLEAGARPRWLHRLAVLGGEDVADRLRLSRAEATDLARLRDAAGSSMTSAALGWKLGQDLATGALYARAALLEQDLPPNWAADVARGASAVFPVSANDLMPHLTGPALGARLNALEAQWLARDLRPSAQELLG
jgi:poly(A) polymerase